MTKRLSNQQIELTELLLNRVSDAIKIKTGKKPDIKDISAEFGSDLYQRDRFPIETYESFIKWCAETYDVRVSLDDPHPVGSSLFLINLAHSELKEQDIFDRAADEFEGNYILFTWVGNENARLTWIELKPQVEGIPTFEARRNGLVFYGIYYGFEGSLFLFGHNKVAPMSRSLFFTKANNQRPRDLIGIVSGASYDKTIFASSCYAHALEKNVTLESMKTHIGDQTMDFVVDHYPHLEKVFEKYGQVQMDIPRAADD